MASTSLLSTRLRRPGLLATATETGAHAPPPSTSGTTPAALASDAIAWKLHSTTTACTSSVTDHECSRTSAVMCCDQQPAARQHANGAPRHHKGSAYRREGSRMRPPAPPHLRAQSPRAVRQQRVQLADGPHHGRRERDTAQPRPVASQLQKVRHLQANEQNKASERDRRGRRTRLGNDKYKYKKYTCDTAEQGRHQDTCSDPTYQNIYQVRASVLRGRHDGDIRARVPWQRSILVPTDHVTTQTPRSRTPELRHH